MIETLLTTATTYNAPQAKTARNGNPFAVVQVRCSDAAGNSHFVSVIAFDDDPREAILRLTKGENAAIAGSMSVDTFTAKNGETRPRLNLTATRVLSVYQGNKLRKAAAPAATPAAPTTMAPAAPVQVTTGTGFNDLDDDLPF